MGTNISETPYSMSNAMKFEEAKEISGRREKIKTKNFSVIKATVK